MFKAVRALVAFAVVAWVASPAQAQTRVPYRAQVNKACQVPSCTIVFPLVAAKRRIELDQVSCLVQFTGATAQNAYIYTTPAPTLYHYLIPEWERSHQGTTTLSFGSPTGIFATAGQRFVGHFVGFGPPGMGVTSFITCSLYGEIVILP